MYLNLSLNPRPYCQSGCKEKPIFLALQMFLKKYQIKMKVLLYVS
jgi:hypothetical protein